MSQPKSPAAPKKDPNTVVLETPLVRGEQTIEHVTVRKPDAGALRGLKLTDVMQMDIVALTTLLPRITSPTLTGADVSALDAADLLQFGQVVSAFFLTKADKASFGLSG